MNKRQRNKILKKIAHFIRAICRQTTIPTRIRKVLPDLNIVRSSELKIINPKPVEFVWYDEVKQYSTEQFNTMLK